jgi:hypothetical protein
MFGSRQANLVVRAFIKGKYELRLALFLFSIAKVMVVAFPTQRSSLHSGIHNFIAIAIL